MALAVTVAPKPAFARDDGAVAAGVIGGLAVGAIVGSQVNRGYYDGPGYMSRVISPSTANATPSGKRLKTDTDNVQCGAFASAIDVLVCVNLE